MASIYNNGETLLVGTAGNDWFLDNNGEDSGQTMVGGLGNDVYEVDSTEDYVLENVGGGIDTVEIHNEYDQWWWYGWNYEIFGVWDDYTLDANVENLTVYGSNEGWWWWQGSFAFVGNADANVIDISNTWGSGGELYGLGGNDTLIGSDGSDWLEGGTGSDRMVGGWGDDRYYVADAGDLVIEVTDNTATTSIDEEQGEDTVYSDVTYIAPTGVENVVLWGKGPEIWDDEEGWINGSYSTVAINATGNALDNDLIGNDGNNVLSGLGGEDFLLGRDGNDILAGGAGEDLLYGGAGNDNLDGGDGEDFLDGDYGNDVLLGGNGEDFLGGGSGNDKLDGGAGEDFLYDADENGGNDTLLGGLDNDFLDSGLGADRLEGGAGNDLLSDWGDGGEDTNVLLGGEGNDLLEVIDNNGANTLDGGNGNDVLIAGNSQEFFLPMGGGEDNFSGFVLNGGAGDDSYFILGHESAEKLTVLDSLGNDTIYLVNGGADVREILGNDFTSGEGSAGFVSQDDMMHIFTMAAGIENLYADGLNDGEDSNGANAMYLIGNAIDNRMVGTDDRDVLLGLAGNDTLEGGAGADDMVGGAGNDLYIVGDIWSSGSDSAHDTVVEAANEGIDTVWAYESYKLENNVEHLRLFGWENLRGTGNALDNSLIGNGGDNYLSGGIGNDVLDGGAGDDRLYGGTGVDRLDGGSGWDFMNGGAGSDTYFVDNESDTVFEFSDLQTGSVGGTDTVFASVNFELGANIENLTLTGSDGIGGWGNDDSNVIVGNAGDNYLGDGSTGWNWNYPDQSTITGGGKDTLIGGAGNDAYYVNWTGTADIDVITDSGGTGDWVGLHVTSPGTSYNLNLGAGNLTGIEHLTIYGSYIGAPAFGGFNITTTGTANNYIDGSDDSDTIGGGAGNDILFGQNGADVLKGDVGDDWLYAGASWSTDDAAGDTLIGGDGNDYLDSTDNGADRLEGGNGNDYYFMSDSALGDNTFVELAAGGSNDVVEAHAQDIDLSLLGTGTLIGNIEGAAISGYGDTTSYTVTGTGAANFFRVIDINANGGSAALYADDITLIGGAGNDFYVVEQGYYGDNDNLGLDSFNQQHIFIEETTGGGTDTLRTYANVANYAYNITLADNVENMVLAASHEANGSFNYGATAGIGNAGNNTITGNAGETDYGSWNGSAYTHWYGNELTGGGGNDVLLGDKGDDWLDGDYYGNTTLVGTTDRMVGGKGDDYYVVNSTGDVVVELANEGDDWIGVDNRNAALTYTLAANVEDGGLMDGWYAGGTGTMSGGIVGNLLDNDLTSYGSGSAMLDGGAGNDWLYGGYGNDNLIGGTGNDDLYGNDGNDTLNGGAGNDWLNGGSGNDTLIGGDGNDGYYVDSTDDVVTESTTAIGSTADEVNADLDSGTLGVGVGYTLGAGVENLWLGNMSGAVNAVGNNLNNEIEIGWSGWGGNSLSGLGGNDTLEGSYGSDWLDGGAGNDWMFGSDGSDHYYVDSTGDFAMEAGNESGNDTVHASNTSFNLATNGWNIENIEFSGVVAGTAAVVGIGNELSNFMNAAGVTADNVYLQGGGGHDILWGGSLADILDGGAGDDSLVGGTGADTMTGGMGDDYYMVDNGSDLVFEAPGNGDDWIESSVSFLNMSGVEVLKLSEGFTAAINATGLDTQGDTLLGNSNDNMLDGGEGNDWLSGGNGNDMLIGGDGNDTFAFDQQAALDNVDTVSDFVDGEDLIALDDDALTGLLGYSSGNGLSSGDFTSYDGTPPSWTLGAEIGYNSDGGGLYYSALGDGSDLLQIGTVTTAGTITQADFIVI